VDVVAVLGGELAADLVGVGLLDRVDVLRVLVEVLEDGRQQVEGGLDFELAGDVVLQHVQTLHGRAGGLVAQVHLDVGHHEVVVELEDCGRELLREHDRGEVPEEAGGLQVLPELELVVRQNAVVGDAQQVEHEQQHLLEVQELQELEHEVVLAELDHRGLDRAVLAGQHHLPQRPHHVVHVRDVGPVLDLLQHVVQRFD